MKISYNWLTDYLKCSLDVNAIALLLTDIGLEVEAIEKYESIKGGLKGFVTGKVITREQHPNADKLSKTTVDVGGERLLDIVCGAPNVAAGQKVIVALEGATVYKGDEGFKIGKSKIRGEVSEGMICAEDELGVGQSHEGILVLPEDTRIGLPASDYFSIVNDTMFEIGITPNHADALSHIGVARDLAAAIKVRKLGDVSVQWPDVSVFKPDNNELPVDIVVEDVNACPRYSGVTVSGITVGSSPEWLKNRLKAIGIRPINNVVDISNYILFEYGQPLHTFDAKAVDGKVVVKKATPGSKFITLDHVERNLSPNDLLINNATDPMCLAGVFGGEKSGVTSETTSVFIESAYFEPVTIRKTSKLHSLKTDASFRFERGTDPEITVVALKRAAMMIKEIAGGRISSEIVDIYPSPLNYAELELKYSAIDKLIGEQISHETIIEILEALDIKIKRKDDTGLFIAIPTFKVDVKTTSDIVEEILRIYGYNKIESGLQMRSSISYSSKPDQEMLYNRVADYLVSNNFNEILTNSLSSSAYYNDERWFNHPETVAILNPLSKELDVMRQSLLFGGLESVAYNINRKQQNLKFFEFGTVYKVNTQNKSDKVTDRFNEKKLLSIIATGQVHSEHWNRIDKPVDFYFLNGYVINILKMMGVNHANLTSDELPLVYEVGQAFRYNNKPLYSVGILKPELGAKTGISQQIVAASIEWDYLVNLARQYKVTYKEVSRFPEVRRDLALVLENEVTYNEIEKVALKVNKHLLKRINLFDVYEGDKIEAGKKSYAVSFILQDESKTLTDKEIDSFMNKLAKALEQELGARIRK
jgi:phenylalanyl-tRNA synthetase beta chain